MLRLSVILILVLSNSVQLLSQEPANWPQGTGPLARFSVPGEQVPTAWSVVRNQHIRWRKTLSETGQSTVITWGTRIFFTTMEDVSTDSQFGQNIVAYCCEAATGKTLWKRTIKATHPLRLSGCFSDSSAPPALTDGKHVVFFNASGTITCFDLDGKQQWSQTLMAVGRSQPFLLAGQVIFIHQTYMPDEKGHFSHEHKNAPVSKWTQIQALDLATGKLTWRSRCGANMGCLPLPHRLASGRDVIFVGRGGGHSPPETPEGISMIDGHDGETIWTLPLPGFMSTMSYHCAGQHVLVFHNDKHLWVDTTTGKITRQVSFLKDISVRRHTNNGWETHVETLPAPKKKRAIIQQSNVLVGKYHYFRSYTRPYLGRIQVDNGSVQYLQLPVQLKREPGDSRDQLLWDPSGMSPEVIARLKKSSRKPPQTLPIHQWCFTPNEVKNSRGYVVMGDARSRGTGWGHHASQVPTASGKRLFVPVMNGTVYVIAAGAPTLDEHAILSINDLGPVGKSFNRASLSFSASAIFAHTIHEVICIGN